jgi:hypothetical protein
VAPIAQFYLLHNARTTFRAEFPRAYGIGLVAAGRPDVFYRGDRACRLFAFYAATCNPALKFFPPLPMEQTGERCFSRPRTLRLGLNFLFYPAR